MNEIFPLLAASPLFQKIPIETYPSLLRLLRAKRAVYAKNEFLLQRGEPLSAAGLMLSGQVDILREDFWGNRSILARIPSGQLFGETYACLGIPPEVSVMAASACEVLFLDLAPLFVQPSPDPLSAQLCHNLTLLFAARSLALTRKISHLSRRSLREKLLSYLSQQAAEQNTAEFEIPFNRQQLADFLSADRSALSAELSRLQKEGLLDYRKNHFILYTER